MIVWPVISRSPMTANSRPALTATGQFQTTVSGVSTMKISRTASWIRKHPRPGPRAGASSSPRYWTGPVWRGRRGGVGSAFGSTGGVGSATGSATGSVVGGVFGSAG